MSQTARRRGDETRRRPIWERLALDGIEAAGEALYPRNDFGAPDFTVADLRHRGGLWLDALPPDARRKIVALFVAVELALPALVPARGRLSRVDVARRLALFEGLRASRLPPLRFLADAVKSATTMLYLSHPAVMRHLGAYKTCDHPAPVMDLPVRPEALP